MGSGVSFPAGPGEARPSNDIWCIFGLKMLYLARLSTQLRGLGSTVSSPSGSERSPATKRHLVHFWSENAMQLGDLEIAVSSPSFNAAIGGLGSAVSSPTGSGWSPAAKRHLVHFWSENALSGKALNAARDSGGAL